MKIFLKKYLIFYICYLVVVFLVSDEKHYLQNAIPPPLTFMACDSVICVCSWAGSDDACPIICEPIIQTNTTSYLSFGPITPNPYKGIGQVSIPIIAGGWYSAGCEDVSVRIYMLNGNDSCDTGYLTSQCLSKGIARNFDVNPHTFSTPCNLTQHTYRVSAFLETENLYTSSTFFWGQTDPILTVNLGRYRMNGTDSIECRNSLKSVSKSFNNPDENYNNVHVNINYSPVFYRTSKNVFWDERTLEELDLACEMYARNYDSWTTDSQHVYYALNNQVREGSDNEVFVLGISKVKQYPDWHNWSFIFMDRIEEYPAALEFQSFKNAVSIHELLHQLGKVGNGDHYFHENPYAYNCALHLASYMIDTLHAFDTLNDFFRICNYHITRVRNNFDNLLYSAGMSNGKQIIPFLNKQSDDKYKLIMSLPKTTYLKYEPVVAKFEVINNDTIPLNIWDIFWTDANYLRTMRITDNLGYTYQINQSPGDMLVVYKSPDYIVQPRDTFIISMSINNWGKDNETRILGQFGYFPSDRTYEAQFKNEQLISNIVEFEVIELNQEDNELLNLLKNKQTSENTLKMYGDNPLVEHIYAKYFLNSVQNYYDFFNKYPTSFYMYYDRFMSKFFTTLFTDVNNIDNVISSIKNTIDSDQFKQFLSNDSISKRIKEILKNYKPKNKKKKNQ